MIFLPSSVPSTAVYRVAPLNVTTYECSEVYDNEGNLHQTTWTQDSREDPYPVMLEDIETKVVTLRGATRYTALLGAQYCSISWSAS